MTSRNAVPLAHLTMCKALVYTNKNHPLNKYPFSMPVSAILDEIHHTCKFDKGYDSVCRKGLGIDSMVSPGQIKTMVVPRQTTRPSDLVSSLTRAGSSGSEASTYTH